MNKKTPDCKKLIAMENGLIPNFAKLSKMEKRFLGYCIAQLNPMTENKMGLFTVNIADIAKVFNIAPTHTYPLMRAAAITINSCPVFRVEEKACRMDFWFQYLDWFPETGQIEIQFSERLTPLLLELKEKGYIQYSLCMSKDFTNKGWSLYVILKQWLQKGSQEFELNELKILLGIEGKYKRWAEFSRQIIIPATENINNVSDINVVYDIIKRGRAVVALNFTIRKREPNEEEIIEINTNKEDLIFMLQQEGVNKKTAKEYADKAERAGKIQIITAKFDKMVKRAEKHTSKQKYLLGAIRNEIDGIQQREITEVLPPRIQEEEEEDFVRGEIPESAQKILDRFRREGLLKREE